MIDASIQLFAMLLPSPTQATSRSPRPIASWPKRSPTVWRSASTWHGCEASVSAFTIGTEAQRASSSSFACSKVRTTSASR